MAKACLFIAAFIFVFHAARADYQAGVAAFKRGDAKQAAVYWQQAADNNELQAIYNLGWLYENGSGVKKDLVKAKTLYQRAYSLGSASAAYKLGAFAFYGLGAARDTGAALRYMTEAAQAGHAQAQYRLAQMYDDGNGVAPSLTQALYWYHQAAERGVVSAQTALGQIYLYGTDTMPADSSTAEQWFKRAALNGDGQAALFLAGLLANDPDPEKQRQAKIWAEQAQTLGGAVAAPLVELIDSDVPAE